MTGGGDKKLTPLASYVSGCVAGSAGIITGFPFDTIKVRLQHQQGSRGTPWGTFKTIIRHQGVPGLFKGLTPQLVGGALECGVNYAVYNQTLAQLSQEWRLPLAVGVPLAGGVAGVFLSLILSPTELIKCRLQAADARLAFANPRECIRHLLRTEGWMGLTRGLSGTLAREVPGNALYFTTYAALRRLGAGATEADEAAGGTQPPTLAERLASAGSAALCGGAAGMLMWAVVLPLDVAKTRMQVALPGSRRDMDLAFTLRALRREGKLYMGLAPTLVRAFPSNAAQWVAWELMASLLQQH